MIMASERLGNIEDLSYKDDISLFSQIGEYSQMQPFRLKFFVLLVCLNGHGSLNINGVDYRVDAGKMFVCKPHIIVEKSSVSLDFECRGMALSSKFIDQLGLVADGGWDLGMFLGKNPVLSLSEDEKVCLCSITPSLVKNHAFLLPTSRCRDAGIRGHQPMHHRRCAPPAP